MKQLPEISSEMMSLHRGLQQVRMAWYMFWFVVAIVAGFTGLVFYCILCRPSVASIASSTGLDGLFGWSLRAMIRWLFESDKPVQTNSQFISKFEEE